MLTQDAMLAHPDWTQPFIIDMDACMHGLGAVLSQKVGDQEKVVAYASRALELADNEQKYTIWELETLAVVWACDLYRWYLWNKPFKVRTDGMQYGSPMGTPKSYNRSSHEMGAQPPGAGIRHRTPQRLSAWQR